MSILISERILRIQLLSIPILRIDRQYTIILFFSQARDKEELYMLKLVSREKIGEHMELLPGELQAAKGFGYCRLSYN